MRTALFGFALILLSPGSGFSQGPRDDWRYLESGDIRGFINFRYSLEDARLDSNERDAIYGVVDKEVRMWINDGLREEESATVLNSSVGFGKRLKNGSQQIVVRGTDQFCSPVGNCMMWIFLREMGTVKLLFATEGNGLMVRNNNPKGLPDLIATSHGSAFETSFTVYRWNKVQI
jgi:hypothetical protein